jgi:hypothetical protein
MADYQREFRVANPNYRGSGRNKSLAGLSAEDRRLHAMMVARRSDILQRQRKLGAGGKCPEAQELVDLFRKQAGICPLTGWEMSLAVGPRAVSVDQKVAGGGYDLANVQLVCWAANRAKGDLSEEDFIAMCVAVVRRNDYLEREYSQVAGSAPQSSQGTDDIV